ncbi:MULTISPECIES: hypothetical protein [unclassified Paenibacillus]|uniref:hypothetical protein n=1 Tax=unclassified Paenibacillus TaxID=185978 RepID=UPI001AE7703B|nr:MULTISPECIES: hypothetical protein [unclassified Paenibacillus]MBP1155470.1 hypothetical protein [Paenibacillus sp. PvP091]MBP1169145.1 hypothetical protein [Paenibacillus sp. PvR098]MBP2440173.1 hypothetical protein [Paenibacillus sp. PvP052]
MDFTSQDIAVIEQALQIAIRSQSEETKAHPFHEVLAKLKTNAAAAMVFSPLQSTASQDGIFYDYDDSSDLL